MEMLIGLRLPLQRVNYVLEVLASAPYRTAAPLIDEIHAQMRMQVEEENQKWNQNKEQKVKASL